jgi:phage RecT family recombinase
MQPTQQVNQLPATIGNRQTLRTMLEKGNVTTTLERISTRWLKPDQVKTQAMLAVARNPALLQCTQVSFMESMVRATELGLRFAGAGGEAYLVPYKSSCTLVIGYRGLCALARRTGMVTRIEARCVHEKDEFEIAYGSGQQIKHRPHLGTDRGSLTCAYALAELKGGAVQVEVMTRGELDAIMARSRASGKGPWKTDYEEMCRKTVVRRLCKYLPFPTAFEDTLASADPEESEERECEYRRHIDSVVTASHDDEDQGEMKPVNVDVETGEMRDVDDSQATGFAEAMDAEMPTSPPRAEGDFAAQKNSVLSQIYAEIGMQIPGNNPQDQAARLKKLQLIFGSPNPDKLAALPLQILQAGLQALKNQSVNEVTE